MKPHQIEEPGSAKRPCAGFRHVVAASAFLAAGLSCAVFITLFRAPMPVDAFAALGERIATAGASVAG